MKTVSTLASAQLANCSITFEIDSSTTEFENYGLLRGSAAIHGLAELENQEEIDAKLAAVKSEISAYLLCNDFKFVEGTFEVENEYGTFIAAKRVDNAALSTFQFASALTMAGLVIYGVVRLFKS